MITSDCGVTSYVFFCWKIIVKWDPIIFAFLEFYADFLNSWHCKIASYVIAIPHGSWLSIGRPRTLIPRYVIAWELNFHHTFRVLRRSINWIPCNYRNYRIAREFAKVLIEITMHPHVDNILKENKYRLIFLFLFIYFLR